MSTTQTLAITTGAWTQVTGLTSGTRVYLEGRFSFYVSYDDTAPTETTSYLVEDNKDTTSSICTFSDVVLGGKMWLRSKNLNQNILVTSGKPLFTATRNSHVEQLIFTGVAYSQWIETSEYRSCFCVGTTPDFSALPEPNPMWYIEVLLPNNDIFTVASYTNNELWVDPKFASVKATSGLPVRFRCEEGAISAVDRNLWIVLKT